MGRTMRWGALGAPLGVLVLAIAALAPTGADAHALVDRSDPAAGSTIDVAPERVRVWFTEPVDRAQSALSVVDAMGMVVDRGDSAVDAADAHLATVSLQAGLPHGVYAVRWQAVTADGGRTSGTFRFGVGVPVEGGAAPAAAVPTGGIDAAVSIDAPADGAAVTGADAPLAVHLRNVTLIAMDTDATPAPGTLGGHIHVLVNGAAIGMFASTDGLVLHGLANGPHVITVALAAPDHRPYDPPIEATARITVSGSDATGPATVSGGGMAQAGMPAMAPAATGNAGLDASGSSGTGAALLLAVAACALVVGGRAIGRRRRSR